MLLLAVLKRHGKKFLQNPGVAEETISCIKTVAAFSGEQVAVTHYNDKLAASLSNGEYSNTKLCSLLKELNLHSLSEEALGRCFFLCLQATH